jgi:hypothetical protein
MSTQRDPTNGEKPLTSREHRCHGPRAGWSLIWAAACATSAGVSPARMPLVPFPGGHCPSVLHMLSDSSIVGPSAPSFESNQKAKPREQYSNPGEQAE